MNTVTNTETIARRWKNFLEIAPDDIRYEQAGEDLKHYDKETRLKIYEKYTPNGKICFMGCGNGREVRDALDAGYDAVGVNGGELCKVSEMFNVTIINQDIHATTFKNNEFDAVGAFYSFEHSPAPLFVLAEWYRILKDNGYLFIYNPKTYHGHQSSNQDSWRHPLVLLRDQLVAVAGMIGFKIVEVIEKGDEYLVFQKTEVSDSIRRFIYET